MRRFLSLVLALMCMMSVCSICVYASEEVVVQPRYLYFVSIDKYLKLENGVATYSGTSSITVNTTNYVKTKATLQRNESGVWKTVTQDTAEGGRIAIAGGTCSIINGYYYRVRVDAWVYTAAGTMIESVTEYSTQKYY